jgi:hypothetical protein
MIRMTEKQQGIELFRSSDALGLFESATMSTPEFGPDDRAALAADGPRSSHLVDGTHDAVVSRGEGDEGFFVPSDAPYAREAGPAGVEVLELRSVTSFGMKIPGGQPERLRRAGQVTEWHGDARAEEPRARIAG